MSDNEDRGLVKEVLESKDSSDSPCKPSQTSCDAPCQSSQGSCDTPCGPVQANSTDPSDDKAHRQVAEQPVDSCIDKMMELNITEGCSSDAAVLESKDKVMDIVSSPAAPDVKKTEAPGSRVTQPRVRGYQERRRFDRDRRDNWRKNEKKDKGSNNTTSVNKTEPDKSKSDKAKIEEGDKVVRKKEVARSKSEGNQALPVPKTRSDDRERGDRGKSKREEIRSPKYSKKEDKGQTEYKPRKEKEKENKDSKKEKGAEDRRSGDEEAAATNYGGAEILNMLNLPKKDSSGGRGKSGRKDKGKGELKEKGKTASDLEAQWQKEVAEKKRKEEEEMKKIEDEKRRIEEENERKRKAEEDEKKRLEEEKKMLDDFVAETAERIQSKVKMRQKNEEASANRPDESFFSKLDSSLKKNTAFVKKLKNFTDNQSESLKKDFNSLNLSKYVEETAAALTEAKLKMSDVNSAVQIASLMYQRYADFAPLMLESWHKVLLNKKDEKVPNPSKLRVDLRFFAELVAVGVFTQKIGLPMLATQLTLLIAGDKDEHNNLTIVISFCKHCGDDYAGLLPRKFRLLAEKYNIEILRSKVLPSERQTACRNLLKDYYQSLSKHIIQEQKDLKSLEKKNRQQLQTKGELSSERKEKYEAAQVSFQKLLQNTTTFSDLLDEDMPDLPKDESKTDCDGIGLDLYCPSKDIEYEYDGDKALFEDEDTRQFYESLPNLRAFIPGILYKDSEQATAINSGMVTFDAEIEPVLEEDAQYLDVEFVEKEMEEEQQRQEVEEKNSESESKVPGTPEKSSKSSKVDKESSGLEDLSLSHSELEDDDGEVVGSMKLVLEQFLSRLPNCVNRELIDKAAVDFCMNLNTKGNRKKLVKALFTVQRTRYDLLPFYARLVATLHPCMPDVASDLVTLLKGDFRWHVRKKDQINIESKLKTVRFIGELVKFVMFPKVDALHCIKMLMFDFSHHNIEMACALLDTAGRFLYRSPDSHHRTKVYLDVMMRKKAALHLDSRYTTIIENAYYYSNPPDVKQEAKKERPAMHEYIRKLLYKDLSKVTTEKVLKQMRKLNWDDPEVCSYASKCLMAIWNIRYNCIHCCANLLAGLAPYHETVAVQVIDGILEDIRLGMEVNHPKYNQRRVSAIKYLGEFYNYRMVESLVIFKILYSLISFGVSMEENNASILDPPEHLFRIRLVCVLLDTCGQYFDRGSSKKRLDCFLIYFQRYYWMKRRSAIWTEDRPFPMDVEYLVRDSIEPLRPKQKIFESWEDVSAAAEELDKDFREKLAQAINDNDESVEPEDDYGLPAIQETDEIDELSQSLSQLPIGGSTISTQESDTDIDLRTQSRSQSQSRSQNVDDEQCAAEDDEASEHEDSDMLDSTEEEEEELLVLAGGPKHIKCPEDDDFMTAFDKMLTDNIQSRNSEAVKVPQFDIAVPVHIKKTKAVSVTEVITTPTNTISFVLMTRRGNKQQFSNLSVPVSENFATKYKAKEVAERMEKEKLKKMVLDIHERQEEEDYQEMLAAMSRPAAANLNRDRRVRYQHPRGAPDADLIFGSK